jgi:nitroreductase
MDFYEVIKTRRSVRSYKNQDVPEDKLRKVMNAARIAPSGNNKQPWKFIIIKDRKRKEEMATLCHGQSFIAQAPVLIVACGRDVGENRGGWMGDKSTVNDVTIAIDHLTLAARAEGLATCWIGAFDNSGIKKFLNIPGSVNVVALTPLGFPENENAFSPVSSRKQLDEILCYEKWSD